MSAVIDAHKQLKVRRPLKKYLVLEILDGPKS